MMKAGVGGLWCLLWTVLPAFSQCPVLNPPTATTQLGTVSAVPDPAPSTNAPVPDTTNLVVPTIMAMTTPPPSPGTPVDCSGGPPPPPTAVNGACGADNGATLSSPPVNLCSAGTSTVVSGTGPWTWSCLGSGGGTDSTCSASSSSPPPASLTLGETSVFQSSDQNNGNYLIVQDAALAQGGTVQGCSVYARVAAGSIRIGIYDASGPGGAPRRLIVQTPSFVVANGWTMQGVTGPAFISPGNYWLAFLPTSNNLVMPIGYVGSAKWKARVVGSMPSTFPSVVSGTGNSRWSVYCTLAK